MPENFIQSLADLVAFSLELPNLSAKLMPLGFSLLELLFRLVFFPFDFLVFFEQPGYFCLQFFECFHRKK